MNKPALLFLMVVIATGSCLPAAGSFWNWPPESSVTGSAPAMTATATATWVGGNGDWSTASNWSPTVVPNNGTPAGTTYVVIIDNGAATSSQVHLNTNVAIDSLTINGGDRLDVHDGQSLTIVNHGPGTGTIVNDGILALDSNTNPTALVINGNMTLSGNGVVQLSNSANNQIYGLTDSDILTNQDSTLSGAGNIGMNSMTLNNQGTITSNATGNLVIDPGSGGVTNGGTIQATNGGMLIIQDGHFSNSGGPFQGTIQAINSGKIQMNATASITGGTVNVNSGAQLALSGGSISGGTLNNSGSIVNPAGTIGTLGGAINNLAGGLISLSDGSVLMLTGGPGNTYANAGTISITSLVNFTDLIINGNVTLSGNGSVQLLNSSKNRIYGAHATDILTNQGNTISGAGNIGNNSMTLNNQGLVSSSNVSQNLIIDPGSGGVTNGGTMQSNSGTLVLQDGAFTNTGSGTIQANNLGTINMNATASITGGTVNVNSGAHMALIGGSITGGTLNNSGSILNPPLTTGTLGGVVNNLAGGLISLSDGSVLMLTGGPGNTYTNSGTISISAVANFTDLVINGNVTLSGNGSVQLLNSSKNRIYGAHATDILTNQGNTISGAGNIGNNSMTLNNQGLVSSSNVSQNLIIDPGSGGVTNGGTIQSNSGTLVLQDGAFVNTGGTILASNNGTINMNATASITGGTVNVNSGAHIALFGGSITGGTLNNSGSILNPPLTTGTLGGAVNNLAGGAIGLLSGSVLLVNSSAFTTAGLVTVNNGSTLTMGAGNNFTQTAGQTTVNGTLNASGVNIAGGILNGTGIVNADVSNSGRVDPGQSPGVLSITGNYTQTSGGTLGIELNGVAAGSGYDQVHLVGAAVLTGNLSLTRGFPAAVGDKFKIIDNDSSDPVSGIFNGLPEAAILTLNGQQFQIGYAGGSGNDVELTTISAAPAPTITWNNPADLTYGTALSATQLNATASVPGTFTYNPPSGTLLNAGNNQTLSVNFTATDPAYSPASKNVSLNVLKANQTITFDPLTNKTFGDPPFTVSATASSGLPVSFSILSGPASISGATVTITGAGHVVVRAVQEGDSNYDAAPAVDQPFDVTSGSLTVINNNNSGAGSLRQAIADAGPGATIGFAANVRGGIILDTPGSPGLGGELLINKDLTIIGPGANVLRLLQESESDDRVMHIAAGNVSISGLSISGGSDDSSNQSGSGVLIDLGATLALNACTISRNNAFNSGGGGGIYNFGTLDLSNSTVESNTGPTAGIVNDGGVMTLMNDTISDNVGVNTGGVRVVGGTTTILNCTIANNGSDNPVAGNVGGLRIVSGATVNLRNTIVANNVSGPGMVTDVGGTVVSQGRNLIGDAAGSSGFGVNDLRNVSPKLGGLANNGGTTETYSLLSGSPAINAGINNNAPATDQRGVARPQGGTVDIGAYESGVRPAAFGKIVFVSNRDGNNEIYSLNANGTNQTRLTNNPANDSSPNWSADGSKIVFTSDRDGNSEIYSMAADGSNQTRLTNNSVPDIDPTWSPDGSRIAFSRNGEIFVMDDGGSNVSQLTTSTFSISKTHPSWSPDGAFIVFQGLFGGGNQHILIIPSDCSLCSDWNQTTVGGGHFISPAWSPDGNAIAYTIDDDEFGATTFLSHRFDFFNSQISLRELVTPDNPKARFPAWSPDGAELVSVSDDAEGNNLYIINADGTNSTILLQNPFTTRSSFPDWSGFQTTAGGNSTAISGTVSITFSDVSTNGTTTAVPINAATAGTLPGGFSLGSGLPAYEITTTAAFTPPITICINVPSVTDPIVFAQLKLLHNESGLLVDRTTTQNFSSQLVCGSVNSLSPFVIAQGSGPTAAPANISGQIMSAAGTPLEGVVMTLTGPASPRRTITNADGRYAFTDVPTDGFYTVTPWRANYTFAPAQRSFDLLANKTDAIFTATANETPGANPLDTAEYFVRQQYVDILGREPDEDGFNYWSEQILACGADATCVNVRRRDVAAAFFIEQEFQQSGSFIFNLYKAALGRRPFFTEYAADRLSIVGGGNLVTEKAAFARTFVERPEFRQRYALQTTAESFVEALVQQVQQSSGVDLSSQRNALIARYNHGANQSESRSFVLRELTESTDYKQVQYDAAFVLTEYFAYLRREPDQSGYDFWLNVLKSGSPGDYRGMVCSFVTSTEYQYRFSSVVSHNNAECAR